MPVTLVKSDWTSGKLRFRQVTSSGAIEFGEDDTGLDVVFYGATSGAKMTWDESADGLIFDGGAGLVFGDSDLLKFGDAAGGDATIGWDGSQLEILPTTDDTGALNVGDGTTDFDVKIFLGSATEFVRFDVGNSNVAFICPVEVGVDDTGHDVKLFGATSGSFLLWDESADQLDLNGADIRVQDNDEIRFGDASGGDVALAWDGSWLAAQKTAHTVWNGAPSSADPSVIAHEFLDDFVELDDDWTVTEDSAAATQAVGDANFGVVTLTNAATTDDDACQIQYAQETFQLINGKEIWFETRIRCAAGDATNLDFFVGLAEAEDLTGVADNMPANGFGFHKDDGDTNVDLSTSDGGANVEQATVHTLVDNTWVRLGLHFDGGATGSGTITPYIDGVAGTAITTAAYATMAEISPIFMIRNGDATTTQTLEIDYVKVVQER